jgi:uncharacterized protein (DUF2461 family)
MKEIIKIDREDMIQDLINSTFDHIQQIPETLDDYLRRGFKGFEHYTDEELVREYRDYISEDPTEEIEIILEANHG